MCLWLITACLGLLPSSTNIVNNVVVSVGVPTPIVQPTTASTAATSATTTRPTGSTITNASPATQPPSTAPIVVTTGAPPVVTSVPTAITSAATAVTTATTAPTAPSLGGVLLPVILCNNPDVVCLINPNDYETTTGPPIDPRLGTTPPPGQLAALHGPPIIAYNVQVANYDGAVRFPRDRRSVESADTKTFKKLYNLLSRFRSIANITKHKIGKRQATNCKCVAAGTCPTNPTTGAGLIDVRIVNPGAPQCPAGQVYCCTATTPSASIACGTRQAVPAVSVIPNTAQANYGEFPWQAMVLTRQNDYIAGGVLIDQFNVLTVTHRLTPYIVSGTAPNVKVRLGEWDASGVYEPIPYQEYNVVRVFSHPSYNALTLQYDITVLRLASAVPFTPAAGSAPTINRACLPTAANSVYTGQRCVVSGWGRDMFGLQGQYQQILKMVDVPIVAPALCQTELQVARLGSSYVLDTTSFLCAGGEVNRDSCTGDGGSGLMCQVSGQWTVVGLVSWGLGCANANVPGVYVNVAALLPWIQQQVATL